MGLRRVGMTTIPIQCSLLQPAEQEQGSKMMTRSNRSLSRTRRACNKNSIWLASKSFLINVTYALVLRVIMLNNNIKNFACVICASYWVAKLFERPSYWQFDTIRLTLGRVLKFQLTDMKTWALSIYHYADWLKHLCFVMMDYRIKCFNTRLYLLLYFVSTLTIKYRPTLYFNYHGSRNSRCYTI